MTDILVTSPFRPFTLPTQFKAVFNGYIYCGTVDAVDPSVSQVQVYLVNEAGDKVPVAQPLRTNAGGYLVYNGQPAKFVTDSNHSLLVQDSHHVQVWYAPNMATVDPETVTKIIGSQALEALRRSYAGAGYGLVAGSFERGGTATNSSDVLLFEAEGKAYSWGGELQKTVPSGSTPTSTGGISASAWIDRSKNVGIASFPSVAAMLAATGFVVGEKYSTGKTTWVANTNGYGLKVTNQVPDIYLFPQAEVYVDDFLGGFVYTATGREYPNADPGIQRAVDLGAETIFSALTDYEIRDEIEITTSGQVIRFSGSGGYGYGDFGMTNWAPNCRLIAKTTLPRRIRTRRNYRETSASPQDAPLSCMLNIQAENVTLYNPCTFNYFNPSDTSPANLGSDVDIGIFIGCRVGVQMYNPQSIGYFRVAGCYVDVTHADNLPRFNSKTGAPFPLGCNVGGCDGISIYNPYFRGGLIGLAVLGAKPKAGQDTYTTPYYDELLGAAVPDKRGSFGASDFNVYSGRLYARDHHSGYRAMDPTLVGGVLTQSGQLSEPDFSPAALYIDGLAGNTSGNLWGFKFRGTRAATFEMFRVRLGRASRVLMDGLIEGRPQAETGVFSTTGTPINTSDYTTISYGDIASATVKTSLLEVLSSFRDTRTGGLLNHYYGDPGTIRTEHARGDTRLGRLYYYNQLIQQAGAFLTAENGNDVEIRSPTGQAVRLRNGSVTHTVFEDTRMRPGTNNTIDCGVSGLAWKGGATVVAFQITSDATKKTDIATIDERLLDAAENIAPVTYRLIDSVTEKGELARHHIGYIYQDIDQCFRDAGVDPFKYGILCETQMEDGTIDRSVRYEELHALNNAAIRRKLGMKYKR